MARRTAAKFCTQIRVLAVAWARWDVAEGSSVWENFPFF